MIEVYSVEQWGGPDEGDELVHIAKTIEDAENYVDAILNKRAPSFTRKKLREDFTIRTWKV